MLNHCLVDFPVCLPLPSPAFCILIKCLPPYSWSAFLHTSKRHSGTIKTIKLPGLARVLLTLIGSWKIYYVFKIKAGRLPNCHSFIQFKVVGNLKTLLDFQTWISLKMVFPIVVLSQFFLPMSRSLSTSRRYLKGWIKLSIDFPLALANKKNKA